MMRQLSDEEIGSVSGADGIGSCRELTWWERQKVAYVGLWFGEEVALKLARSYQWS
jgi:hypothetical protein